MTDHPPICDYEGSDYQSTFWDQGGREYEDRAEAIALRRLLPPNGQMMLEIGAGAGRNTLRYGGFEHIVLMDYSLTQMQQAQVRLGKSDRFTYVAADVYRLPFVDGLFDGATMIRVLHHIAEPLLALRQVRRVMGAGGSFILEYANKQNLKAILRYVIRHQHWNPFTQEPVEFVPLNYDFHPAAVRGWLTEAGFALERQLTVSHFRLGFLKRLVPAGVLAALDSLAQLSGDWWQLTPSVFTRSTAIGGAADTTSSSQAMFCCPTCTHTLPDARADALVCPGCAATWPIIDGIYDFRGKSP